MHRSRAHGGSRRALACGACAALLCLGAPRAGALTLAEGLAIVERSGRDAAISLAREQVLASAPVLAGAPYRPSVDAYARETLLRVAAGASSPAR